MDLMNFLKENIWTTAERGRETAVKVGGIKMRRWLVKIKTPDFSGENELSSDSRSTPERRLHSTSPEFSTGRPLSVRPAAGKKLVSPIFLSLS